VELRGRPASDVVRALASEIHRVLGDELVGLYTYGSWVSGGFDPGVSDIDLVAITSGEVQAVAFDALDEMHQAFVAGHPGWADRLEIVYVGLDAIRSFRTSFGSMAVISPGEPFHIRRDNLAEWLQNWYLVRETGLCLRGAAASAVFPKISWAEFAAATVRYADELQMRSRVGTSSVEVAYTVLTMCRALRTVRAHAHGSKLDAATWTREQLPNWAWLIDEALACRLSRGAVGFSDAESLAYAEAFIAALADEVHKSAPRLD
jgi:predicted nucleotidyltransferase